MSIKIIILWSCWVSSNKKSELSDIIENQKLYILRIQETMLGRNTQFRMNNYSMIHKGYHRHK